MKKLIVFQSFAEVREFARGDFVLPYAKLRLPIGPEGRSLTPRLEVVAKNRVARVGQESLDKARKNLAAMTRESRTRERVGAMLDEDIQRLKSVKRMRERK
jgi:hypothetical protein